MDNNLNDLNNIQQSNPSLKQPEISEQSELTERITTEEAQYKYLKELNKKLTLFKKQGEQSGKKNEETEKTMKR